jgi:hypothetical protein
MNGVELFTIQLKLKDDIAAGTAINIGAPTGTFGALGYVGYFVEPFTAALAKTTAAESDTIFAAANVWSEDCEIGNHTATEEPVKVYTRYATCTTEGVYNEVIKCKYCDEIFSIGEEKIAPALGHTEQIISDVAPTCTEKGFKSGVMCSACGEILVRQQEIPAKGHIITAVEAKAPTCTEVGYESYEYCSECDYTTYVEVEPSHLLIPVNAKAPTCIEAGYETYEYCSACYYTTFAEVPATGHSYNVAVIAPTCTEVGVMTYTCVCGDTYADEIAASGHVLMSVEAKTPTCTETGYESYEYCSVCDYTTFAELPITDHSYNTVITVPTCTTIGYTTHICSCGDVYVDDYTDPRDHNFKNGSCVDCNATDPDYFTFSIQEPSRTTVRYNDGIKLHATMMGTFPQDARIDWTSSNSNFNFNKSDSGNEITIVSKNNGYTTFTATVYDADNKVIAEDKIEMYSKSGFFDKIGGFFRGLFGLTKIYEN